MSKIKITQQQMRKLQESLNESVIVEQTLDQVKEIQSRLKKCFSTASISSSRTASLGNIFLASSTDSILPLMGLFCITQTAA